MDTTFVLGLMVLFFILPGIVVGAGVVIIHGLKPGYLTRRTEKVLVIICIILAIYGASIVCTEVEGSLYTGQPIAETYLTDTQGERMFPCSGGRNCSGVLALHKGKYAGLGHKSPVEEMAVPCNAPAERYRRMQKTLCIRCVLYPYGLTVEGGKI